MDEEDQLLVALSDTSNQEGFIQSFMMLHLPNIAQVPVNSERGEEVARGDKPRVGLDEKGSRKKYETDCGRVLVVVECVEGQEDATWRINLDVNARPEGFWSKPSSSGMRGELIRDGTVRAGEGLIDDIREACSLRTRTRRCPSKLAHVNSGPVSSMSASNSSSASRLKHSPSPVPLS